MTKKYDKNTAVLKWRTFGSRSTLYIGHSQEELVMDSAHFNVRFDFFRSLHHAGVYPSGLGEGDASWMPLDHFKLRWWLP